MEQNLAGLIPPPSVVREKLSQNLQQGDLLRRLLKLSLAAATQGHQLQSQTSPDREEGDKR